MTASVRCINFFPIKSLEQGAQFSKSDTFKVSLRIQPRLHTFWTFPSLFEHCGYSSLSVACKQPSEHFACLDFLAMLPLLELSVAGCFSQGCSIVSSVRSHLLPPYLFRRLPLPPLALFSPFAPMNYHHHIQCYHLHLTLASVS